MAAISIPTAFNISLEFEVASLGRRLVAWIIDTALQLVYLFGFLALFYDGDINVDDPMAAQMIFIIFCLLPMAFYHFVMEWLCKGQSLGKMAMGIRVVDMLGGEPGVSQYMLRLLFRPVSLVFLLSAIIINVMGDKAVSFMLILGFISLGIFILFVTNKYSQRLGDTLAGTMVIRNRAEADINKTIYLDVSDKTYTVRYPEVMKLSDRDINGIRNLLSVRSDNRDTIAYTERIATRVQQVLNISSHEEPRQFLEQLLWDYNYLTKG